MKKEGESPNLSIRRAITADTSPKNFQGVPLYARMVVIGRKIKWVFIWSRQIYVNRRPNGFGF